MKRLLILSGKGGTGKTTAAAAFIRFSQAKAFADCDVDAPNLHLVNQVDAPPRRSDFIGSMKAEIDPGKCIGCGECSRHCRFNAIHEQDGEYAVLDYACEGCGVCEYVCPANAASMHDDVAGELTLFCGDRVFSTAELKMGRGNSGKLVAAVKASMDYHAPKTDLAVIDGSPGIGCPVIASISGADLVLIVAEPSLSGLSDMDRILKTAKIFEARTAVCVNKWNVSPDTAAAIRAYCESEGVPFAGMIPFDPVAAHAANAGISVADMDCPARDALREVYNECMKLLEL